MANRTDWEQIGPPLGSGGQSEVFLVRRPSRAQERTASIQEISQSNPWAPIVYQDDRERPGRLAEAVWKYARTELPSDLGAMKAFKVREAGAEAEQEAVERLRREIAILQQNRPGLPQLLDSNEAEGWIVSELFPEGTLERHPERYKGQAGLALRALRSLVETVALLHEENIVHRDIKPANVFIRQNGQLVLGDFGIVYMPNQEERLTRTGERVGPRDYMPPWGDLGERLQNVRPNFDVYMLGKLLWCMVAGRQRLPREYHKRPGWNLTEIFPRNPDMHIINFILDRCVVEEPRDCLESAQRLLTILEESLAILDRRGQLLSDGVPRPCRVCGKGLYHPLRGGAGGQRDLVVALQLVRIVNQTFEQVTVEAVRPFACDSCGHIELFSR